MLIFSITSDSLDEPIESLEEIAYRMTDLRPFALEVAELITIDNMAARMQGVDKDNEPFAELAQSTWEKPHRGLGPPLAPMETASRIISGFETEVQDWHDGALVIGSWPSMNEFLEYHVTGTTHMPSRDPVGVRPSCWAQISDAFDIWVETWVQ